MLFSEIACLEEPKHHMIMECPSNGYRLPLQAIEIASCSNPDGISRPPIDTAADKLARMIEAIASGQPVSYADIVEAHAALSVGGSIHQPINLR